MSRPERTPCDNCLRPVATAEDFDGWCDDASDAVALGHCEHCNRISQGHGCECGQCIALCWGGTGCCDAAEEIKAEVVRLRADNARLRSALTRMVDHSYCCGGGCTMAFQCASCRAETDAVIDNARAALEKRP